MRYPKLQFRKSRQRASEAFRSRDANTLHTPSAAILIGHVNHGVIIVRGFAALGWEASRCAGTQSRYHLSVIGLSLGLWQPEAVRDAWTVRSPAFLVSGHYQTDDVWPRAPRHQAPERCVRYFRPLDQAAARVWVKRTGMCLIPAIRFDLSRSTFPASSICSSRLSRSVSIRRNSRRAR
jgi:hypothetical protein